MTTPQICGIVNITTDSFYDGGKYVEPEAAIAHAEQLAKDGADILDLGAASSNPHAGHVPPELEIQRLTPVIEALTRTGRRISIDTTKPEVQRFGLSHGVEFLNDIRGFPDESLYPALAASKATLVVMHFISDLDKAVRVPKTPQEVFASLCTFFDARLPRLEKAGIARERLIVDPGMGFFLASNPEPSLAVLAHLPELKKRYGLPVMISVSRKSFLKNLATPDDCDIQSRTLAAELFSAMQGVDYIRTHDVGSLHQALLTLQAISRIGAHEQFPNEKHS